jgi:hypothetical protein
MSLHDAFARFTPYELSFPDTSQARAHFDAIRSEADARQVEVRDPQAFVMLAATGQALREIRSADDDPALIRQYGLLLFHSFHFCEEGEALYLIETGALRDLLDKDPETLGWTPSLGETAGYAAGYAQLPQHLVWVRSEDGAPPESLDGFFWVRSGDDHFGLLLALGMRGERPGFSVVAFSDLPLIEACDWSRMQAREEGGDFSSSIPGSELEGLYELRSVGEVLKLASRVLWRIECGRGGSHGVRPGESGGSGPRASELGSRRIGRPSGAG